MKPAQMHTIKSLAAAGFAAALLSLGSSGPVRAATAPPAAPPARQTPAPGDADAAATSSAPAAATASVPTSAPTSPPTSSQPGAAPTSTPPATPAVLVLTSLQVIRDASRCNEAIVQRLHGAAAGKTPSPGCGWTQAPASSVPVQRLLGAGDVEVSVSAASYDAAMAYLHGGMHRLNVFFNGVDLSEDAELVAVERLADQVFLHYHVTPGPQSRAMWSALVRTSGSYRPTALALSFGWDGSNPISVLAPDFFGRCEIAVTTPSQFSVSLGLLAILFFASLAFARRTDLLRDPVPDSIAALFPAARRLSAQLQQPDLTPAARTTLLQNLVPGYAGPDTIGQAAAQAAVDAALYDAGALAAADRPSLTIQLALSTAADPARYLARRMSYSLARVQLFCWFMFALLAGLFLWLIYAELPALDNSMLALLGISAGTSGLAWTVDKSSDSASTLSQNLLFDLVTGPGNRYEVHRFQAVLVNVVLLVIGIAHIARGIAYPVFDPSWLVFLGISGTTYIAGKQIAE